MATSAHELGSAQLPLGSTASACLDPCTEIAILTGCAPSSAACSHAKVQCMPGWKRRRRVWAGRWHAGRKDTGRARKALKWRGGRPETTTLARRAAAPMTGSAMSRSPGRRPDRIRWGCDRHSTLDTSPGRTTGCTWLLNGGVVNSQGYALQWCPSTRLPRSWARVNSMEYPRYMWP